MEDTERVARSLKGSRQPLYTQAIQALQELLERGHYKPGEMLPSEDVLAKQLGISRSTLREALGHIETHGLISRRQGIGTFVGAPVKSGFMGGLERLESFRSLAAMAGMDTEVAERQVGVAPATVELATPLGVALGSDLVRVQVVEAVNGLRSAYLDTHLRVDFANLDELTAWEGSVIEYLSEQRWPGLSHTRSEILAIHADAHVAAKLDIPQGRAALHLSETYYTHEGEPIAVSLNYFLTDRFRFYFIRRVPNRGRSER